MQRPSAGSDVFFLYFGPKQKVAHANVFLYLFLSLRFVRHFVGEFEFVRRQCVLNAFYKKQRRRTEKKL